MEIDRDHVLAFRFARVGLARRAAASPAEAAPIPVSDFARDAALLALAARGDAVTRETFDAAIDDGSLVLAHVARGAIHALAPDDHARFGRALLAADDDELGAQLGHQVQRMAAEHGLAPTAMLAEVADVVRDALAAGEPLDKDALHAALRERERDELMPWCRSCGSHHVAPMLWRYATVAAGARLDARRRYVPGDGAGAADPVEAARRFLRAYGPAAPGDLADWAGLARPQARRLWDALADELAEVRVDGRRAWLWPPTSTRSLRRPPPRACACCRPATPICRSRAGRCWRPTRRCASGSSGRWPARAR